MDITIATYNCCSLRKNIDIVRKLADRKIEVIFLQETFLTEEKIGELDFIDENYESVGIGATYSERSLVSMACRPEGGMACLWRSNSRFSVNKIILEGNMCLMLISVGGFN